MIFSYWTRIVLKYYFYKISYNWARKQYFHYTNFLNFLLLNEIKKCFKACFVFINTILTKILQKKIVVSIKINNIF